MPRPAAWDEKPDGQPGFYEDRRQPSSNATQDPNVPTLSMSSYRGGQSDAFGGWGQSARSMGSASTSARWNASLRLTAKDDGTVALAKLRQGNLKYLSGLPQNNNAPNYALTTTMCPIAIVSCCTPVPVPVEAIFGLSLGELACIASASLVDCQGDDGGAAAMEFSMAINPEVHLMLVLETIGVGCSPQEAEVRVWAAVKRLLHRSEAIRSSVSKGAIFLHAALLDLSSGQVEIKGEHEDQAMLLKGHANAYSLMRPVVPAEEALAMMQCGNVRAAGKTVQPGRSGVMTPRKNGNDRDETEHFAMVFMNYDAHNGEAPMIEKIFDVHPAQLTTICIKNPEIADCEGLIGRRGSDLDGYSQSIEQEKLESIDQNWLGYIHWADHCLTEHAPRLILVLGRAPVDAPPATVQAVKEEVFSNMLRLLTQVKRIKSNVATGELQVEGAIYFGKAQVPPGHVEWLGAHPEQHVLVDKMIGIHADSGPMSMSMISVCLTAKDYVAVPSAAAQMQMRNLQAGNQRYLANGPPSPARWSPQTLKDQKEARAIILAGANGAVRPAECLFDSSPGELVVHRTCGAIAGRREGCALSYLEELVRQNPEVPLLLVLGDVLDPVVDTSAKQAQRITQPMRPYNAQIAVDQMGPAVVKACRQMLPDCEQEDLVAYATELHVLYVQERMLRDSDYILGLVQSNKLEVQGAVVQADGSVRFMQGKPDVQRILEDRERANKYIRKGQGLGSGRPSAHIKGQA